ncbi:tetratricopeptide repeat protein [Tenacibaculum agarivorans]|uniref:tetratricopeptide repeat protein n=1 Tax=Tenacibaculum agarivorans TaxID=1908389 RepID=UPI0013567003|nr:tetratricopeptide repeat protein [Tenacibaculum agarivorans]
MITQNLHKIKNQSIVKNKKRALFYASFLVFYIFSLQLQAQDSLVLESSISEKKLIDFEKHFFDALTQKATYKYQKAIDLLEHCNSILPNEKAVLFELSKNYHFLNKYPEALEYAEQAIQLDPQNVWLLEHLVTLYKKSAKYEKAIEIQEGLGTRFPKKRRPLVFLHLLNNDKKAANKVLDELTEAKLLNQRLRKLKSDLRKKPRNTVVKATENSNLKVVFEKQKSFQNLSNLLLKLDNENNSDLLNYSEEGLSLFPAQPFVYLMNGKALNKANKYKKAIESLQNGIDFVIDDRQMEKRFYLELMKAYKAVGDSKNVNKYQKKLNKV